jgi:hypothetical protein
MPEHDKMKWPKDHENASQNADEDQLNSESVLDSTSDRRQDDSGTDILEVSEIAAAQDEAGGGPSEPQFHQPLLEPIADNTDVEIESFTIEAEDSGLELPEEECLGLQPAADVQVVTDTSTDALHDREGEVSGELAEGDHTTPESSVAVESKSEQPVTGQPSSESPALSEDGSETQEAVATEEKAETEILLVKVPGGEQWFPLSDVIVQTTGEAIGETAARWITRLYLQSLESPSELQEIAAEHVEASSDLAFPQIETTAETTDYRERLKKTAPKKSILKELAGIILGGLGGLLIAYYALNWFGGPRYDFAKIPLPGIHHTYKHAPSWLRDFLEGKFWTADVKDTEENTPENQ